MTVRIETFYAYDANGNRIEAHTIDDKAFDARVSLIFSEVSEVDGKSGRTLHTECSAVGPAPAFVPNAKRLTQVEFEAIRDQLRAIADRLQDHIDVCVENDHCTPHSIIDMRSHVCDAIDRVNVSSHVRQSFNVRNNLQK